MQISIGHQLPPHPGSTALLDSPLECSCCHATDGIVVDRHWSFMPFCAECLERAEASQSEDDVGVGD